MELSAAAGAFPMTERNQRSGSNRLLEIDVMALRRPPALLSRAWVEYRETCCMGGVQLELTLIWATIAFFLKEKKAAK